MTCSVIVSVVDPSGVAAARRAATAMAAGALDESALGRLALVTTEAASNLLKHAGGGDIVLRSLDHGSGVEVLAIDRGRGMADVTACLRDGYSTAGSPGTGLGAIGRVADSVDIYSDPGRGTILLAQVTTNDAGSTPAIEVGAVCVPHPAEVDCGDAWSAAELSGITRILIVDGLGHGPVAQAAARLAVETFDQWAREGPGAIVEALHDALRSTRGAALAIAELDGRAGVVRFCGVGNIRAAILDVGSERRLVSHNGTAGHQVHRIQEFVYPWPDAAVVVLHTDGVTTHWDLAKHPGLLSMRHPAIIAGLLYRDFRRMRDDATVVVARRASRGRDRQ